MKEFFDLIPPGWTVSIVHDNERRLFEIYIYDNIGAGNKVAISPEFIDQGNPGLAVIYLKRAFEEVNKIYGF